MLQNFDWNNIRSINGSQKDGFEELVCQLARNEKIEEADSFVRKGAPDAGVECFWVLSDGSEIAWQAKFFTSPLTNTQWGEIDKSVKTAINKHPKTKRYIVSIPQDRADARIDGKKSFLEKWNDRVRKWQRWAEEKEISIIFEYEGSSELLNKLSLPNNIGKMSFWFNKNEFTDEWFENQNIDKITSLGARYSPDINVDLDVKNIFNGLYNSLRFKINKVSTLTEVKKQFLRYLEYLDRNEYQNLKNDFQVVFDKYFKKVNDLNVLYKNSYEDGNELLSATIEEVETLKRDFLYKHESKFKKEERSSFRRESEELEKSITNALHAFRGFDALLAESPFLLIEGNGGVGKSHLIADVISEKRIEKQFSILLLGQHFRKGNIWQQILQELGIKTTKDEFLGALNSKAESTGSRIIIYVDAINEGEGKYLWKDRLLGFINDFKNYNSLGLVLSIRNSYKEAILPEGIKGRINSIELFGFENDSIAITKFFEFYKINEPPVPILNPEFSNPLFLKLFCKGLYDNGLNNVPVGYEGISTIFEYSINASNRAISSRLDYDYRMFNLVKESVDILIEKIIESPSLQINKKEAYNLLTNKLGDHVNDSRKILSELINEDVVNENIVFNSLTKKYDKEVIYFSYERLGDHLIVNSLIEKNRIKLITNKNIDPDSKFYEFIKDENSIYNYQGLVDAMSIQLPEKIGLELYELLDDNKIYEIGESFLKSLIWRKSSSIKDKVLEYVNDFIATEQGLDYELKNVLVQLSIKKGHYFNALFLHQYLYDLTLSERDKYWTLFINDSEYQVPYTLVQWTRESQAVQNLDEESKKLLGFILVWFLTSSNREFRDNSTKALVRLFKNDLVLLKNLIEDFRSVNDMYVLERLYAVAYGVSLLTFNSDQLSEFASYIYNSVFKEKIPYEHLLLRDYARGVIEFANFKGLTSEIKMEEVRPPYGSKLPLAFPTEEYVKQYDIEREGKSIVQNQLYDYVMGFSDFARYSIGRNGHSKISVVTIESLKSYEKLYDSLREDERQELESIFGIVKEYYSRGITDEYRSQLWEFIKTLKEDLQLLFKISSNEAKLISDYMINSVKANSQIRMSSGRFDLTNLQRLIIRDVFEESKWEFKKFGIYDARKFDYFNKKIFSKKEAIGKKYIWIAYHKWLSIIFDNFLIQSDYSLFSGFEIYNGAWNPFERDIDPSLIVKDSFNEEVYRKNEVTFWSPNIHINIDTTHDDWVFSKEDVVNPKELIQVFDKKNTWLNLLLYNSWSNKGNGFRRDVWYHIKSYIVKKSDKERIVSALSNKSFWNHSIPQEQEMYEVFNREYYWSQAYEQCSYYEEPETLHDSFSDESLVGSITSKQFTWYSDRDFSLRSNVNILRPNKVLFDLLDLKFEDKEHLFYDKNNGELIVYNPAIENQKGTDSLLVRKDVLLTKLYEKELDIIWCVLGAKEVIASSSIIKESHVNNVFYFNEDGELDGDFELQERKSD